jgi:hypothetical protein
MKTTDFINEHNAFIGQEADEMDLGEDGMNVLMNAVDNNE